jgi:hypothetical protein
MDQHQSQAFFGNISAGHIFPIEKFANQIKQPSLLLC